MSDYAKITNFTAKDTLPSGNADKVVKGSELDNEFDAIETAVATKSNSANPTFTGTVTAASIDCPHFNDSVELQFEINGNEVMYNDGEGLVVGICGATEKTSASLFDRSGLVVGPVGSSDGGITIMKDPLTDVPGIDFVASDTDADYGSLYYDLSEMQFYFDVEGTNRLKVDTQGITVNGTVATGTGTSGGSAVEVEGTDGDGSTVRIARVSADASPSRIIGRKARGTPGSEAAVSSSDTLFALRAGGHDGTSYDQDGADIEFVATENWTGTNHGTRIDFGATANGSTVKSTVASLTSQGLTVKGVLEDDETVNIKGKLRVGADGTASQYPRLQLEDADASQTRVWSIDNNATHLRFYTEDFTGGTNGVVQMRLVDDGSYDYAWCIIGGPGDPEAHLHVKGSSAGTGGSYNSRIVIEDTKANLAAGTVTPILEFHASDQRGGYVGLVGNNMTLYGGNTETLSLQAVNTPCVSLDTSGNVHVGENAGNTGGTTVTGAAGTEGWSFVRGSWARSAQGATTSRNHLVFYNPNGVVGSISTSGSSTSYATTSDARVKTLRPHDGGARDRLASLPVHSGNYNSAPGVEHKDFMTAQDIQAVFPEVVEDISGGEGPELLGVDYSKLVPFLIATCKEQDDEIETLKATVAALDARLTALEKAR